LCVHEKPKPDQAITPGKWRSAFGILIVLVLEVWTYAILILSCYVLTLLSIQVSTMVVEALVVPVVVAVVAALPTMASTIITTTLSVVSNSHVAWMTQSCPPFQT